MRVATLRETKFDEGRVGLTPDGAAALVARNHSVYVETGAGQRAGYADDRYAAAGATIVDKADLHDVADLIVKVKIPSPDEYADYRPDQILFTYLHLDENITVEALDGLVATGITAIGYEDVNTDGCAPLLEPMSQLTGYLFAQRALEICTRTKGVLCAGNESFLPGARAVLIGTGRIGLSVLRYYTDLHLSLTVLARSSREQINRAASARFCTDGVDHLAGVDMIPMDANDLRGTQSRLGQAVSRADIVINAAVRRMDLPIGRLNHLIDRSMVGNMPTGSVVCDATACDYDFIETCRSSSNLDLIEWVDDHPHYSPDHIPALVPRTATQLLTKATMPYVIALADHGLPEAFVRWPELRGAVGCAAGSLTHAAAGRKKGRPVRDVNDLLPV